MVAATPSKVMELRVSNVVALFDADGMEALTIVNVVPPEVVPLDGEKTGRFGSGTAPYVNPPALVTLPPGFVSTTSTAPALWDGITTVTVELSTFVILDPGQEPPPNVIADVPFRFVPEIVIVVPPAGIPLFGEIEVMVGEAR
jgi:hypothetical protein